MMIFNVFGRLMGVKRGGEEWLLFRVTLPERKYVRSYDIVLPEALAEADIAGYLGIFIMKRRPKGTPTFSK